MPAIIPATENPYVGPRTFERAQGHLFFGREAEARDLLSRVVSERLLLFYAQSGAGKSSLVNARLIPALQEAGFAVLPVGRVSGDLPPGVADVPNIFLFNLKVSLDEGETNPNLLAAVSFGDFLARLASEDGVRWAYDPNLPGAQPAAAPAAAVELAAVAETRAGGQQPFVLIIDQFEEIITTQAGRWPERAGFFTALNEALLADPNLWLVLTLREDYVAALDPYAPLLFNRLRARFYMERMGVAAALDAVSKPAALAGRPFDPGVAEQLVDNLRQVRIPGQEQPQPGQYVEPVQLQVVCYQLWENIKRRLLGPITAADLQEAGDVDKALVQFYEETLTAVLADPAAQGLDERQLRTWFSSELITESETRGLVHQGRRETGSLPNPVVRKLQGRFLVRVETRAGGAWVELVHDRFVEPILESNRAWFVRNQSPITQAALAWDAAGQPTSMLLSEEPLVDAQAQLAAQPAAFTELERTFVNQSQLAAAKARARRQGRMIMLLLAAAVVIGLGAVGAVFVAIQANASATRAVASELKAKQAALSERNARATADAEQVIAVAARGTAETLVVSLRDLNLLLQQQWDTLSAKGTAVAVLADNRATLIAQIASQLTPSPEVIPSPLPTPTASRAPAQPSPAVTPTPRLADDVPSSEPTPTFTLTSTAIASALEPGIDLAAQAVQAAIAQAQAPSGATSSYQIGEFVLATTIINLRNEPGIIGKSESDVSAQLAPGPGLLLVDGPTQVDGVNWWQVSSIDTSGQAISGWVAEAIGGTKLIQPVPKLPDTNIPDPATGTYLRAPFDGAYAITQLFGENPDFHSKFTYDGVPLKGNNSLDFATPAGTPIYAVDDGTVRRSSFEPGGLGNYVLIEHGWGESLYGQMDSLAVAEGQAVRRGELIGSSGNSGASTGPHLDFKMRINPYSRTDGWGGYSDPLPYLPPSSYVLPSYLYETTTQ